jgi:hypothetical protein
MQGTETHTPTHRQRERERERERGREREREMCLVVSAEDLLLVTVLHGNAVRAPV